MTVQIRFKKSLAIVLSALLLLTVGTISGFAQGYDSYYYSECEPQSLELLNSGDSIEDLQIIFDEESDTYNTEKYALFYSEMDIDEVGDYFYGLSYEDLDDLDYDYHLELLSRSYAGSSLYFSNIDDLEGYAYDSGKDYNVYVASVGDYGSYDGILGIAVVSATGGGDDDVLITPPTSVGDGVGNVFLIGGAEDPQNGDIFDNIIGETNKSKPMMSVFCSTAPVLSEAFVDYEKVKLKFSDRFETQLIEISPETWETGGQSIKNINKIYSSDVMYFQGGNQVLHALSLIKTDETDTELLAAVRLMYGRGAVIVGTSAGTAVQADVMHGEGVSYGYLKNNALVDFTMSNLRTQYNTAYNALPSNPTTDAYNDLSAVVGMIDTNDADNGGKAKGFGFVAFAAIDTHFESNEFNSNGRTGRLGRIVVAVKETGKEVGIAVDEDTAIDIEGHIGTVRGSGAVYVIDASNATYGNGTSFSVEGLRINYLTSGDTYNFTTNTVTSTKSLITSFYNNSVQNSTDLFDRNEVETNRLLIDLIKSIDNSANGIGVGYENGDTPFRFTFTKDSVTKGYQSQGLYTMSSMILNVTQ